MSHSRRDFMKGMAAAGAAAATGAAAGESRAEDAPEKSAISERCPYFDQPMYCRDLSEDGKPLCDD